METVGITVAAKQGAIRKPAVPEKDLCESVRNGTPGDVDAAILALKRNNGNIDARNSFGSTALHIAVWRNHIPIVRRLLAAGADVDIRDGESGWSSLHRALHFGHLAVAGVLIEAGANISLEDSRGRTPIDLVSGPVKQVISVSSNTGGTEVFSWGNGANYQLGTGTAGIQKLPCRLDNLQGLHVTAIAAAKFHSVAATADGQLYSWGFGRGGRLGHADFHIHSGQMAVITPRLVTCGLGARRVKAVAVAKHHTIVATNGGEVFTWGSNREGQLGYTSVDTQPTPRRVTSLKSKVIAVAAANKHTAVLTDVGEVFTWGCNREGQLGYGTSNSASNPIPRAVEYLKGKNFSAVSAAKYHTVVLGSEGEVFTWGYKMVMPKRVLIARNTRKGGTMPLKFHQAERLHVVAIAAGTTHSTALSEDGLIFYWVSSDPHLRCYQLLSMAGHQAVAVAAGKYRTAIVTEVGNVYAWDGEKTKVDVAPSPFRIHGIKRATHVAVGENHSLAVAAVYIPKYPPEAALEPCPLQENLTRDPEDFDGDIDSEDLNLDASAQINCLESARQPCETPSLKDLCQKVMAHYVVEPKNALQLLEVADCLGAVSLRKHCEDLVLHNLDYLLTISPMAFAHVTPTLLADVEKSLDASSSQPWSSRHLPTPTAVFPVIVDSEEDEFEMVHGPRMRPFSLSTFKHSTSDVNNVSESMFRHETEVDQEMVKQLRALRKKLQQIEALELKQAKGHILDHQQEAKLRSKLAIVDAILAIDPGAASKIGITVVSTELGSDLPTENFQGKETASRRSSSVRKKSNKSNFEQPSGEEHGKKSKNGRCKRGNLKKEQISCAAQDKPTDSELLSQPPPVEQFQICDKGNNNTTVDHQVYDRESRNGNIWNQVSGFSPVSKKSDQSIQTAGQAAVCDTVGSSVPVQNTEQVQKKRNKKGGLSMFLSGALDDAPKLRAQVPTVPKVEGPAWGGVQRNKGLASLREIQSQQTAEGSSFLTEELSDGQSSVKFVKAKQITSKISESEIPETDFDNSDLGTCRIPLSQFIRSSAPIAVAPVKAPKVSSGLHPDGSPTPWAGTSPLTSASSFKEIQMEQVKHKAQQKHSTIQGSPKLNVLGSSSSTASSASIERGAEPEVTSRWFKPDIRSPSSIRCIQIEETAIKELQQMYKNAKVVRTADK